MMRSTKLKKKPFLNYPFGDTLFTHTAFKSCLAVPSCLFGSLPNLFGKLERLSCGCEWRLSLFVGISLVYTFGGFVYSTGLLLRFVVKRWVPSPRADDDV